jgi:hypothetical protein
MTISIDILATLLEVLKKALVSAYYKQPIPSEIDKKITEVLASLGSCDEKQFNAIVDRVVGDNSRVLGLYAERMASLAVREKNPERVKQGLLGLLIYSRTEDPRDVLLVLTLLHDAVVKLGKNPKEVFGEMSAVVGSTSLLNDFLTRDEEDKSIDAMGYEESTCDEGFLYKRTW